MVPPMLRQQTQQNIWFEHDGQQDHLHLDLHVHFRWFFSFSVYSVNCVGYEPAGKLVISTPGSILCLNMATTIITCQSGEDYFSKFINLVEKNLVEQVDQKGLGSPVA